MAADPAAPAPVPSVWTAIGPSVMRNGQAFSRPPVSGRVPSLALSRYADVVYAASSNGGVWRSDDGGLAWRPLMDPRDDNPLNVNGRADSLACGAVAIHPDVPDRVYVGTGEAFGAIDSFLGVGLVVSQDGGRTWVTEPVNGSALAGRGCYALAVDPSDPQRVVAATRTGLYLRAPIAGVMTWDQRPLTGVPGTPNCDCSSVVCVRGVFYAAVRGTTAAAPSRVLRSTDHGSSWAVVGTGFPAAAGRVTLAVHPERTDTVYAVVQNGDLWRVRLDAVGAGPWRPVGWTPTPAGIGAFVGAQGWYDLALAVDPADVDTVYCGGSTLRVDATGAPHGPPSVAGDVWSSSIWRVRVRAVGAALQAQPVYIGASIHADIHALVFPRGLPGQLWVGCDGGVFATTNAQLGTPVFRSLNSGLATTLVNDLAQHPTEPAVLFGATQDNGGQRSIGDEAWSLTTEGDAGACVVDWNNPYRVLMTYTRRTILRCTDGGNTPASWHYVSVPGVAGDSELFYAPIAGAPPSGTAADANRVAYGSRRVWLSDTFGSPNAPPAATSPGDWVSLPANAAGDRLPNPISALAFAAFGILYAGTLNGGVYRYTQAANPGPWVRTRIDLTGTPMPLKGAVTDIEPDPADASGNSVYITLGGRGDARHVWHFDGANWADRSGPTGTATALLDVQANAIVADPDNPTHLVVATDVGVWRSTDSGANWNPWGEGLPEAAAVDVLIHRASRIIRVGTHGRGAFMRRLGPAGAQPPATMPPVALLVREHRLDMGLVAAVHGLPDPVASGGTLVPGASPDIRCDAPDAGGAYRFPADQRLSLVDFYDLSDDDSATVPTAAQPVLTRVQVLVHNRGARWAHDVTVAVLIAEGRHGTLPDLPPGWAAQVRRAQPVTSAGPNGWRTVGYTRVSDVRAGHPQVATVTLSSALLPLPGALAGHTDHTLLVAVHHGDDPLLGDDVDAETVADTLPQVALRHITVVAYAPAAVAGPTTGSRFLPIGPSPMLEGLAQGKPPVAGRTPGLAVSRHGDIAYAGTANGGVWRSDDAGATWRSCMEGFDLDPAGRHVDSLATAAVAIHPDHPERVFVGTGEPNGSDSYFGVGMLVSLDGGRHWMPEPAVRSTDPVPAAPAVAPPAAPVAPGTPPFLQQSGCYGIAVDPLDPQRAIAATLAGAFLREPDGVGGFHWRRTWFPTTFDGGGAVTAAVDTGLDVSGIACASAGGVTTFVAAVRGGSVYTLRSDAAGVGGGQPVWQPLGRAGWPTAAGQRCAIAMKEDDPTIVYLARSDGSLYRCTAGTWGTVTPAPTDPTPMPKTRIWTQGQGEYDLAIAVDPRNANRIVLGGSTMKAKDDLIVAEATPGGNWFSSIWACTVAASGANWSLTFKYIGARAHADVHRLVFTPGDGSQLWTGNDGGVFRSDNWDQDVAYFVHRNRGLQTLSSNSVDTHPAHDAIVITSTQDNGAALGLGTPGWRMIVQGDSGTGVWHWGDVAAGVSPRVIVNYTKHTVYRIADGGTGAVNDISVPAAAGEAVLFYPPIVGSPDRSAAANANRVAFGGQRLWLTDAFGGPAGDWRSVPANTVADQVPGAFIRAIAFLQHDRIVVGATDGNCYLYERRGGAWIGPQSLAVPGTWPLAGTVVTGLAAVAPLTFFACLGNLAGLRRVWRAVVTLDGGGNVTATAWTDCSGTAPNALLDINHNAIAADGTDLYVAADIGVWRSTDSGTNWTAFADGLPDAAVFDLEVTSNRVLRAATHGRGIYERTLPAGPVPRVRLLLRETAVDRGLGVEPYTGRDHLGRAVAAAASPDIVVDAPHDGRFQTSPNLGIDHIAYAQLADRSAAVATHGGGVLNRVHVQLQNTGPDDCFGATVMLLLAEAAAGAPPPLPADYVAALRCGQAIEGGGWTTLGIHTVTEIDAREPRIASFDLHSSLLPAPDALAGHADWFLLALATHELDPFADPSLPVQALATTVRQAALKRITVVELDGDAPADQAPPRSLPSTLALAVAAAADRRLAALARDSRIRLVSGDHVRDTDRALDALVQAAATHLRGGPALPTQGAARGLGRFAALGAIGLDLPDWSDWLEPGPGWLRDALRRAAADGDVSVTVADALTVVAKTAGYALAATADAGEQAQIRAFCAGMTCAVASDWVLLPVLRGAAAERGPADAPSVDRVIAETWVSRALFDRAPESDAYADWLPEDLPPALLPALLKAVGDVANADIAGRRIATTPAPGTLPDADELEEGFGLARTVQTQGAWGMGIWFLVLMPIFLAPSLGVMFSRFGEHSGKLLKITDDSKGPDDPVNDSDEKSWFQSANFVLAAGAPMPFAYGLALWATVPRKDADFVQFTVAGILRTGFAIVAASTMSADPALRWSLVFLPWIATDLYFLVRSLVHYAGGRPGSGFMYLMQTLPMMGLGLAWLFCLLIRGANLRKDGEFWGMWALFTGLLMGGCVVMAWRLGAGGGLIPLLRDRRDPALPFDAIGGRALRSLVPARALVYADHQLWQQGAGVAGERYPSGMRPLVKLWHPAGDWFVRPFASHLEFRQGEAGAPVTVPLPKVQNAAQLLASLTGAVAGLQGAVVDPAGYELCWPVRVADHGDDQPTWALHDARAALWRELGDDEGDAYLLRHAPRSRTAMQLGAPGAGTSPVAETAMKPVPGFDAVDPLGTDLVGTALGRAGDLAALFQMALAPVLKPGLQATLAAGPTPVAAGREVLRRWNLDERREAEWRLIVGLDALPDQAPERLHPGAAAPSDGIALARIGMLPALDAWSRALRDDRVDLDADVASASMPLLRRRGEAPRTATHVELRDALKGLFGVP